MLSDKERIETLLTALEAALDIADELSSYVYSTPNNTLKELQQLQEFATLERKRLNEEHKQ